tara:strand:- start:757 stop:1011 length:255 start_codon:yes stop_codon:yes gene_type:complete
MVFVRRANIPWRLQEFLMMNVKDDALQVSFLQRKGSAPTNSAWEDAVQAGTPSKMELALMTNAKVDVLLVALVLKLVSVRMYNV